MARMSRKEKIWEGFAGALASAIADKFIAEQKIPAKAALEDYEQEMLRKFYNPIKKVLDKLPDGAVDERHEVNVYYPSVNREGAFTYSHAIRLPEMSRVPAQLRVTSEVVEEWRKLRRAYEDVERTQYKLHADLFNNIVVAESFEEVVEKWPEAKAQLLYLLKQRNTVD